jgi:hypothetical protein
VVEVELPGADEPRELETPLEVEVPEFDAVELMTLVEYAAIPAASTTTTIAAIQVGRIGYRFCGHSFLKPWLQCSIGVCQRCTLE